MKRFLLFFISALFIFSAYSQEQQQQAMERIRTAGAAKYKYGEGRGATEDDAKKRAMEDLATKLVSTFSFDLSVIETEGAGSNATEAKSVMATSWAGTLEDLNKVSYKDGNEWVAMCYISNDAYQRSIEDRVDEIKDLVETGLEQEQQLNISGALKYYVWAYNMLLHYNDSVEMNINGKKTDVKKWLNLHIPAVIDNVQITLADNSIVYNEDDYDKYTVNLQVKYAGKPVSAIDLSYFNGEREVSPVHVKSGEAALLFPSLDGFKNIDVKVIYDYKLEGKNYSPVLASTYSMNKKPFEFDKRCMSHLPIKVNKDKITMAQAQKDESVENLPTNDAAVEPIVKQERKTIERQYATDNEKYVAAMRSVEQAIRTRNFASVENLFTEEGYKIFKLLEKSGTVSVSRSPGELTVEVAGNFIVGKKIPVSIKKGRHVSNENLVFRFEPKTGLIKSVAYALSERAENDIFREAQWSYDSRYALLQFMEDYQTAFALKRLDYIEKIFSDNAVIIVGSMDARAKKRLYGSDSEELKGVSLKSGNVRYTTFNKDQYINKCREDFRKKDFIQLVFEDTQVSKVGKTGDFIDNEVLWIELKQHYVSSNYSDKGYLALQINMRPSGSLINVRTWTPQFIPLQTLKETFVISE